MEANMATCRYGDMTHTGDMRKRERWQTCKMRNVRKLFNMGTSFTITNSWRTFPCLQSFIERFPCLNLFTCKGRVWNARPHKIFKKTTPGFRGLGSPGHWSPGFFKDRLKCDRQSYISTQITTKKQYACGDMQMIIFFVSYTSAHIRIPE